MHHDVPEMSPHGSNDAGRWRFSLVGALLLVFGLVWLLDVRGYLDFRREYWGPVVLIVVGLFLLVRRAAGRGWCGCGGWGERSMEPREPPAK